MAKLLHLSLDEMAEEGYFYSKYDVSGSSHDQYIRPENKEAFLDEMAAKFREIAEGLLREKEVDWIPDE